MSQRPMKRGAYPREACLNHAHFNGIVVRAMKSVAQTSR